MTKWMVPLDLARQIGLRSTSHKFSDCSGDGLWARVKVIGWNFLVGRIWTRFAHSSSPSCATHKQRLQLNSAHQIGLEAVLANFLTLVW